MSVAYWCVAVFMFFPMIFAGLAKTGKGFNNRSPRQYLESLSGWRQRANWAQENSIEAFAPFAAAVIIAHGAGVSQGTADALALAFLFCRVLYGVCYIANLATLRSLVWTGGMGIVVAFFVLAARVSGTGA